MRVALASLIVLSACTTKRTEIVIGVATNLDAPTPLARVDMSVSREGVPLAQKTWMLPGIPQKEFELPGSFGVYTDDGTEPRIEIELVAYDTAGTEILRRRSVLALIKERTLFLRMTLVDSCMNRSDCTLDQTCVEGRCVAPDLDSHVLPDYVTNMEYSIACQAGIHYRDTGTKMDMPVMGPGCGPGETCSEGTCLKMASSGGDGGTSTDGGVTPDGGTGTAVRFAYVANNANNEIRIFTINQATGDLTAATPTSLVSSIAGPQQLLVDPTNQFLLVTGLTNGEVASYLLNQQTGVPSLIGSATVGSNPTGLAIHPSGFVYTANDGSNNVSLLTLNSTTGALSFVSNTTAGAMAIALALDPMGKNLYVVNSGDSTISTFTINTTNGALTPVGTPISTGTSNAPVSVVVDPAGAFVYTANQIGNDVAAFSRNGSTGALTPFGSPIAAGTQPNSVTLDPTGRFAYVANFLGQSISVYSVSGGSWTPVGTPVSVATSQPYFLAVDPMGRHLYTIVHSPGVVRPFTIDGTTGMLTALQGIATGTTPTAITFAR